jgi:DNA-directed RNA polymerase specialized sigma24 family protein
MTQEQIHQVIQKVAKNHRNKSFGYFTEEDIEQEVWIIALKKISRFEEQKGKHKDPMKSLEHWLNKVVSTRLKNLYRDEFVVPQRLHTAKSNNLISPMNFDDVGELQDLSDFFSSLENKELWLLIIKDLNDYDIDILDAILSGENIGSYYKSKIINKIRKILKDYE